MVLALTRDLSKFGLIQTSFVSGSELASGWEATKMNKVLVTRSMSFIMAVMCNRSYGVEVHLGCPEGVLLNKTDDRW